VGQGLGKSVSGRFSGKDAVARDARDAETGNASAQHGGRKRGAKDAMRGAFAEDAPLHPANPAAAKLGRRVDQPEPQTPLTWRGR